MAAKPLNIAGKDWFTEEEAAFYSGVSLRQFQTHYQSLGVARKRFMGRKLFAREELHRVISRSDPWHQDTQSEKHRRPVVDAIVRGRKAGGVLLIPYPAASDFASEFLRRRPLLRLECNDLATSPQAV